MKYTLRQYWNYHGAFFIRNWGRLKLWYLRKFKGYKPELIKKENTKDEAYGIFRNF